MKRPKRATFFIVALLIVALTYTSFAGVYKYFGDRKDTVIRGAGDIRFGIDIQGGVNVTFGPTNANQAVTVDELDGIKAVIDQRLVLQNITDYETYTDPANKQVIVRFPWGKDQTGDPNAAIQEIGQTAQLAFYIGTDNTGTPIMTGNDVASATASYQQTSSTSGQSQWVVQLKLKDSGKKAFGDATTQQYNNNKGQISIWLDSQSISAPSVNEPITDGNCIISGNFTAQSATNLANLITSGALPFAIEAKSSGTISATMGSEALNGMVLAGLIAFALVALFMFFYYRLPGFIAIIALTGHVAGTIAAISGYFSFINSFTLTLPGIAGVILSIGMGVDANILTAERIKEEVRVGKTIDGALRAGSKESFWAIFDGNIAVVIVAVILMGVFGPTSSFWSWLLTPFVRWFPVSTTGTIYSFGYTLFVGVIFNFIMGVTASRLMLWSIARMKMLRNPWFFGGERREKTV